MLILKHLARTAGVEPYDLRMALRAANLKPQVNGRWKWPDAKDEQYQLALAVGRKLASKRSGHASSKSAGKRTKEGSAE